MRFILTTLLIVSIQKVFSQSLIEKQNIHAISVSNLQKNDFKDFQFLKPILKDKKIVWLGENSHNEGTTRWNHSKMIEFLHKEMGFRVIFWESEFYHMLIVNHLIHSKQFPTKVSFGGTKYPSIISKNLFSVYDMIDKSLESSYPISVSGFDVYTFSYLRDSLKYEIEREIKKTDSVSSKNQDWKTIFEYFKRDGSLIGYDTTKIMPLLSKYSLKYKINNPFLSQLLKNEVSIIRNANALKNRKNGVDLLYQDFHFRENQMADNVKWLIENKYKDEKIILISSNYHMLRNLNEIKTDNKMKKVNKNTMGDMLYKTYGKEIYTIAFGYGGGYVDLKKKGKPNLIKLKLYSSSIEEYLLSQPQESMIVETKHLPKPCRLFATFNNAKLADWEKLFDGYYFIKNIEPDEHIYYSIDYDSTLRKNTWIERRGKK